MNSSTRKLSIIDAGLSNFGRLSETNFDDALQQASKLDEHFKETGTIVGPLHGVPISVKVRIRSVLWWFAYRQDQFYVKGLDTTIGFCAWAGNIAQEDSTLIACRMSSPFSRIQADD
jgi:Asp-tRNA(Asn)/Glu-tRNA(Gln) amidotransferase A subunit family amidase